MSQIVKGDKSTLNEKQIVGLINSTPSKRYKSMMTIAADTSKIWCMGNDDGFMMMNIDGISGTPFWPDKEFCKPFLDGVNEPQEWDVHTLLEEIDEYWDDEDNIFAFPTDRDVYIVNCREFCDDMQEYLDEVE